MTAERLLPERLAVRARPYLVRLDALLLARDAHGQAGRMSLIAFAIRIVSAVIAFASQVLMARWMGGYEYGIFVLVWVSMLIAGNLSCLGFHTAVIRFIPQYRETGADDALRGMLLGSRLVTLAASTLFACIGLGGLFLFRGMIEPFYILPFGLGMILLPMIALSDTLQGIARAHAWALAALAPAYILRPVLILVLMGGALAAGFAPTAETALAAAILATYATTIYQMVAVGRPARRMAGAGPRRTQLRTWLAVSLPIFLIEGFIFLLTNADVLVVGFFMDPHDVAIYFATVKTLALVHFVYFAVKAGVAQRYAQLLHGADRARLASFARETVGWTFWPSLLMGLIVLGIGQPMLSLFGPGFDAGYPLLFVLVAGVVARASVGPAESLLTMGGYQNICALLYGLTLAINLAASVILIPRIGLWGAAIATAMAMLFEAAALAAVVRWKLGLRMLVSSDSLPRLRGA